MKDRIKIVLIILILIITLILMYLIKRKANNAVIDLKDVAQPAMNISGQMTPSWYFFHDDKLFVYDNHEHQLFYTDLNCKSKNIIAKSDELRYANFFLVFDNEAYYYTEFNRGIKKINLLNGKITRIIKDKYLYLIPDTLNEGKVLATYENNYVDNSHTFIATLDLKTGELSNEKKLKYTTKQPYYYNKNNGKIYYIESSYGKNNIYEDNNIIYTYESNTTLTDIVFAKDNYIFAIVANKIIKFNINDYSILEEKELGDNIKYSLISSVRSGGTMTLGMQEGPTNICTNNNPMFNSENSSGIYTFNTSNLTFEKIIKNSINGFVQKYNNYYVFQSETETIIYNSDRNNYKVYKSANNNVEGGYIYMMTYTGDFYNQEYDNLTFRITKILLNDI